MTIFMEFLNDVGDDGADPAVLADKFLDRLLRMRKADLREVLFPMVLNEVTTELRNRVRQIERQVAAPSDDATPYDAAAARRDILAQSFLSPLTCGRVLWAKATHDDHEARAAYLSNMAEGTLRTARMHHRAAQIIVEYGVSCLGDIPDFDPKDLES